MIRSSVSADLDARATLETSRAKLREHEVAIELAAFPTTPIAPGDGVAFGEGFSDAEWGSGKTYRAVSVRFVANAKDPSAGTNTESPANDYAIDYAIRAELASDPVLRHAPFVAPRWPFHVEGTIVSETGEDAAETYQSYANATTSIDQYKVKVPLWDDLKVVVDWEPLLQNGQFYFPAYKGERVLVALYLDRARIVRFLDFRPGARLPLDSQGNHLLFGKKADSRTSVQHTYVDEKPALKITRTSGTDKQVITIADGLFRMETEDEGGG